jgi:hypothetical protein
MTPQLIIAIGQAVANIHVLVNAVMQVRDRLRQTGEWTEEQERAWDEHVASRLLLPHWNPEPSSLDKPADF